MQTKRVAIQGIRASFHEEAAFKFFGNDIQTIECNSFKKTCESLKNKQAYFIMMAIENSIAGSLLPKGLTYFCRTKHQFQQNTVNARIG